MIEKDLFQALKTINDRVYPVIMPENSPYPVIVYQVVYDGANQLFDGSFSSRDVRFQIDIYTESYSEAKVLKDEVVAKVITMGAGDISSQDLYDDKTKLFRQLIDLKFKRSL